VWAELPEIAFSADRRVPRIVLRQPICGIVGRRCPLGERIKFRGREPGQLNVEVEFDKVLKLDRQQVLVPPGELSEAIVGEDVRAFLRLAEALDPERRDLRQTEHPSGLDAAVAGKNGVRLVDEDGVGEAELLDARRDLADLLWRMYAGVSLERAERVDRHPLDHRLQHMRDAAIGPGCVPRRYWLRARSR